MNESKKLREVWEWKDIVYEKTKNMSTKERLEFFSRRLQEFQEKTGLPTGKIVGEHVLS